MGPENGRNLACVSYFPIEEYVARINLEDYVLGHMEETCKSFDSYFKMLSKYDAYAVMFYLMEQSKKEIRYSNKIEKHHIENKVLLENDLFFDNYQISHSRIKRIHQLVTLSDKMDDYRTGEVRVSRMTYNGEEIFWRGVNQEDLKKFMDDFLKFYKANSVSALNNNPFLKSALAHLLFVRIHPFSDGNGRTARVIHNIKFTESINKIYGLNLKLCPLNLSQSILLNKPTYARRINDIYFDLEHDSNPEINKWFDFILNMVDEQLFYRTSNISKIDEALKNISKMQHTDSSNMPNYAKTMKLKI